MNEKERLKLIRSAAEKARRTALKPLVKPASDKADTKPRDSKPFQFTYNPCLTSECSEQPEWVEVPDEKPKQTVKHKRRHKPHPLTIIAHKLPMKLPVIYRKRPT